MFPAAGVRATLTYRDSDDAVRQILAIVPECGLMRTKRSLVLLVVGDRSAARGLPAAAAAASAASAAAVRRWASTPARRRACRPWRRGDRVAVHLRRHLHRRAPTVGARNPTSRGRGSRTVTGQGWKLLPIWVGPQASCTTLGSTTKIPGDPERRDC